MYQIFEQLFSLILILSLPQPALDVFLLDDTQRGMTVVRIVDIAALEELVDDIFHLLPGQHLAIGNGRSARQGQRHTLMDFSQLRIGVGITRISCNRLTTSTPSKPSGMALTE